MIAVVGMALTGKPLTSSALAAKVRGMVEGAASLSFQRHQQERPRPLYELQANCVLPNDAECEDAS